ncbi:MAG TPA: dihydrofolate reductase family protein [Thermoanaerobaculia bacterium]|jgi:diaminohydroxyphosphoribosylaminopyrimidine deaminase/5-amino-6-(5-phosphoribosylamino)uracil reductase|nr:dihydrofolate reductase family protein [Thermoanaerobaculia bacterium]
MSLSILTAVSLNGMITPAHGATGESLIPVLDTPRRVLEWKWRIRRRAHAVLVGTGTVLTDDPSLTSQSAPRARPPVRITLDAQGKIPRHYRFLDGSARTLVGVCEATPREYLDFLASRGIEPVVAGETRIELPRLIAELAARGLSDLIVEGGGTLNRALLREGLVDTAYLIQFPAVLDAGSVNLFADGGPLVRFRLESCERIGDFLLSRYGVVR